MKAREGIVKRFNTHMTFLPAPLGYFVQDGEELYENDGANVGGESLLASS